MKNTKLKILIILCAAAGIVGCVVGISSLLNMRDTTQEKTASISSLLTESPTPTATPTIIPSPTEEPTPESTAEPENTPEPTTLPTEEPTPEPTAPSGNSHIVAIDAGHQAHGNSEQEPIGPGASETKAKVASGTTGRTTGVPEYQLTLDVSLKLKEELQNRGYQVVMIRETHDVNISNAERAETANNSGAEIFLRIHANGSDSSSVNGALTMAPSSSNPYVGSMADSCQRLSQSVVDAYCAATGFKNMGVQNYDNMSGINWCRIPVTIVEMGFMTNPDDDLAMQDQEMQKRMASGIADGVDNYFGI